MLSTLSILDDMDNDPRSSLRALIDAGGAASVGAAAAKQALGRVLRAAEDGPIAITRNGATEAYVVSVRWLERGPRPAASAPDARVAQEVLAARADAARRDAESRDRLVRQLRARAPALRRAALARLDQWARERLLDERVIREWREILALPREKAVARVSADTPRARLLRRSSPFMGLRA